MNKAMILAITPQLILSFGVVISLLLVAWQRSTKLIQSFTITILAIALYATVDLKGIENIQVTALLAVDSNSLVSLILVLLSGLAIALFSQLYLSRHTEVHDEYYILLQLVILAAAILVVSDHFASVFLGFELLSVSLVGLVGYLRNSDKGLESAFKYLILSATASSFMLLGIAFIYGYTGNLAFSAVNHTHHLVDHLYLAGIILFLLGLCFKLSLVPFHHWTPDVYQGSPTPVTMLLATVSKTAMFTVLIKYWFSQTNYNNTTLVEIISIIAILSMLVGNIMALRQENLKRLLGYSSIAHMGYLLIVILISSPQGVDFAWQVMQFYLAAYLIASLAIFMVIIICEQQNKNLAQVDYQQWRGLFWRSPLLATTVIVSILSFAGIPLTMGFIGKFYLLTQASQQHLWLLISVLIVGSGIALFYYLRIIFVLFESLDNVKNDAVSSLSEPIFMPIPLRFVITLFAFAGISFGIFPDLYHYLLP